MDQPPALSGDHPSSGQDHRWTSCSGWLHQGLAIRLPPSGPHHQLHGTHTRWNAVRLFQWPQAFGGEESAVCGRGSSEDTRGLPPHTQILQILWTDWWVTVIVDYVLAWLPTIYLQFRFSCLEFWWSRFSDCLKALNEPVLTVCSNVKIGMGKHFPFSDIKPMVRPKIHNLKGLSFSKLSERIVIV